MEDTARKARLAILNAKTSISNPVNRVSSLSGLRSGALLGEPGQLKRAPEFPMSSEDAIKLFKLNDFEIQESKQFDKRIYYAGQLCKTKIRSHPVKMVAKNSTSLSGGNADKHLAFQRRAS